MDSIGQWVLVNKLSDAAYPELDFLQALAIHASHRALQFARAAAEKIPPERSILAGCKRSTDFARVYTIRTVQRLHDLRERTSVYQHVDDISSNIVAPTAAQAARTGQC